jgi:pimeloyl-ACP methyl ester carboxylesterase
VSHVEAPAPGPVERAVLADLAPTFRERRVAVEGGVLRVLEGGEGPPLVVIHGRGGAATSWFPLLPSLARGRRVLAVDLPGFGASRGYRFRGGGAEAALSFFVHPIEAWLADEAIAAPAVVGHSLGGFVALELALRGRVAPSALVLVAAMGLAPEMTLASRLFFHADPERVARVLGPALFGRVLPPPDARSPRRARSAALAHELYAVPGGRPDASAAFRVLAPIAGPSLHRRGRLGEVGAPVLVHHGDHDEVFPSPIAIAAAAALPRGELALVRGGHSPQMEDPEGAVALVERFLRRT